MTVKTNKELYAELNKRLKQAQAELNEIAKFAEEHKLIFEFLGATYVPKSEEIRSTYSEDMVPTEDEEPSDEAGFYSPVDRGTFWVSSNCW